MKDPVCKLIELTGTSTTSMEDAFDQAIQRAQRDRQFNQTRLNRASDCGRVTPHGKGPTRLLT